LLDLVVIIICFFFSSRRRHTRSKRDWSSDVCSSDLAAGANELGRRAVAGNLWLTPSERPTIYRRIMIGQYVVAALQMLKVLHRRSEERRVGKECRSGWWT